MSIKALNWDSLKLLDDGRGEAIANRAIRIARDDLLDRGRDQKERVVTIEIRLKQTGEDTYAAQLTAGVKCPKLTTADHAMKARKQAGENTLVFHDLSPEDVDQTDLRDIDPTTGEIR